MVLKDSHHQLVLEGNIVDLDRTYESRIGIDDGKITEVSPDAKGKKILHLEDYLTFPGFIDPHVHSRVPGGDHKENYRGLSGAAMHGGVQTVIDMPNTSPPTASREVLKLKNRRALKEGLIDVEFFGLVIPDTILILDQLSPHVVGHKIYVGESTGGFVLPYEYLQTALARIYSLRQPATIHCEDDEIIKRNTEQYPNPNGPLAHCAIRSPEAEVVALKKVLSMLFYKVNIAHLSTKEGVEVIRDYKKRNGYPLFQLAAEVTPHHLLLTVDDVKRLGNYAKMNPPLRTEKDRLALIEGLRDCTIDFLASDHAPHTKREKESDNAPSGVPGLDTYGNVAAYLMKEHGLTPQQIMGLTSYNAARFFGLEGGRIEVGNRANITVLDLLHDEKVVAERLYTKCRWSPFEGRTFPGRVLYTIVDGRVYDAQTLRRIR